MKTMLSQHICSSLRLKMAYYSFEGKNAQLKFVVKRSKCLSLSLTTFCYSIQPSNATFHIKVLKIAEISNRVLKRELGTAFLSKFTRMTYLIIS